LTSKPRSVEASSITKQPQIYDYTHKAKSVSVKHIEQPVFVTECLDNHCSGNYTDTLTQSMKIVCLDPRHKNGVSK
jgi:hypothetical protein